MTLLADSARRILREALSSEVGIVVVVQADPSMTTPTFRAKQVLYRFKSEDADFRNLQIIFSPDDPEHRIWILNHHGATSKET